MKIGIIEPEGFSPKAEEILSELGEVNKFDGKVEDLPAFVSDKDAIFVRLKHLWNKQLLEGASSLKFICTPTTGLNHLDLAYLESRAIKVVSLKGEADFLTKNIKATPEHTFGLLLAILRNYSHAFLSEANRDNNRDHYKGKEIFGKQVGIIGMGRVGKVVAGYLEAFGANVGYYDTASVESSYKSFPDIHGLINNSDIVLLTASYSPENEKMIDKAMIDQMKGKYFVNTARGELIDEEYLLEKIQEKHFAGIALDVIANENDKNNFEKFISLTKDNNLVLTPHIAGATYESMEKTEIFIAEKLKDLQ